MATPRFLSALFAAAQVSLSAFTCSACTALIDTRAEQCSSDADCVSLGPAFAGSVCRASVCTAAPVALGCPPIEPSAHETVKLSFRVSFALAPHDPKPFEIAACEREDTNCEQPVARSVKVPDGEVVDLDLPTGFDGLLQITNPDAVSSSIFWGLPVQQDTRAGDLSIQTPATLERWESQTHASIDRDLGVLVMLARDCDRTPLANVQAESNGDPALYFSEAAPDASLTKTGSDGVALFLNVPRGRARLGGVYEGRPLSPNTVTSKAGWVGYGEVFP